MNYIAVQAEDGALEVWPQVGNVATRSDISYPPLTISRVSINLSVKHELGVETRLNQVVIVARSDNPAKVVQTFTFDSGSECERFYGEIAQILGWT